MPGKRTEEPGGLQSMGQKELDTVTTQQQNANNNYSIDNVKFNGKIIDIYEALGKEILKVLYKLGNYNLK